MLRIEMDRGNGWELRGEGPVPADTTLEQIRLTVEMSAIQYPHRALLNGEVVAEAQPRIRRDERSR